ncbi:MAG TPA: AtpZ/AtpI family protein [Candidatus Saccharimonadales bacterium]|nr:AtpZ/AtpI family protein [Candidatus Saccharimonadales bacterium]
MKQAAAKTTNSRSVKSQSVLATIGMDFLDTTWRIAVPVVALTLLGIFIDRRFDTAPGITLVMAVTGFVIAGLLVKRQLSRAEQAEVK